MARRRLSGIPDHVRAPLLEYHLNGVLPQEAWMVAMLSGGLTQAVHLRGRVQPHANPTVSTIYAAMEALSDISVGHEVYVSRWVNHGGKNGRVPLVQ